MARREHALPSGLSPGRRSHRNPARLSRAHELARRTVNRRIGLLGGSFNPAHSGHRAISLAAIDALDLDEVWWLVSPGNPPKPGAGMAPLAVRLASARARSRHAPDRKTTRLHSSHQCATRMPSSA